MEGLIARGGMGEVHRAYDTRHDRVVALKLLSEGTAADEEFRERFKREAHAAARLREPHVIPIHAFGEIDGRLYLDMRLVEGKDLRHTLTGNGPMSPADAVDVVGQIASALDAAHAEGLLHRDVKPSNVILGTNGFAYLVDFGIVRSVSANTDITATGDPVGTLAYMAPERFSSGPVDRRVDVYALACVLFQCLTGAKPFTGENALAVMFAHVNHDPPKPGQRNPALGTRFDRVIAQGMAKNPDERFATAGELAAAARGALTASGTKRMPALVPDEIHVEPEKPRRRKGWLVAAAALIVAAVAGGIIWLQSGRSSEGGAPGQTAAPSATGVAGKGDLKVSAPITNPACDGTYIVIVGSAVNPDNYAKDVQEFLNLNPASKYLHAPSTGCGSLRTHFNNAEIYSVFYGPFDSKDKACAQKNTSGGDSFVRRLDNTSSSDRAVSCAN
jgi:serine/threonine-protein kinase